MYDELIKNLRNCSEINSLSRYKRGLMKQAADAIEDLQDKVNRAVRFYDSVETAEFMRGLNECLPNILDPAWQKAHMEMGFYSPVGEVYKAIGIYDEPPESEGE